MRFLIDGAEWTFPHMDSLSREELLEALREKVASDDRVIVDMLSDGESLDDKDILSVPDEIDVEVHTNTPWGLGLEILDEVKESLLTVFRELQTILDSSRSYEPSMLDEVRDCLNWQEEVFEGIRDAYPEYDGQLPEVAPLKKEISFFAAYLAEGRYAEAQAWHESDWKKRALARYLEHIKDLRDWFEDKNESALSEDAGEDE